MKPTKDNLKEELLYRIECINESDIEEDSLKLIFDYEKVIYADIIKMIDIFGDRQRAEEFEISKYTPIKDYITKEPLKLGDKVKNANSSANGVLYFDDYTNSYVIRNSYGQHSKASSFTKIEENFDYTVDNSSIECRANPHKKKW